MFWVFLYGGGRFCEFFSGWSLLCGVFISLVFNSGFFKPQSINWQLQSLESGMVLLLNS